MHSRAARLVNARYILYTCLHARKSWLVFAVVENAWSRILHSQAEGRETTREVTVRGLTTLVECYLMGTTRLAWFDRHMVHGRCATTWQPWACSLMCQRSYEVMEIRNFWVRLFGVEIGAVIRVNFCRPVLVK